MQKNVGTVDALIRITVGLLGLAYGVGRMSRRPYRTPWLLMALSAMKVAEGVTRFCPMLYAMGVNSCDRAGMQNMLSKAKDMRNQARKPRSGTAPKQEQTKLSAEDKQLEAAVKEYVSYRQAEEASRNEERAKKTDDRHSRDEHLEPTYS
ncbi:YgaP family membrane protein [Brevibacillus aydinogluensis]|jgi:Protein of unknown function (DUF2892)|uniref:DUF2892 domain-containing protein n=1 Tax=Brevibacillus aydinogluensis TaxID=927786 RepID=A0AA48MAC5_9BACL|nr:DUF2892 domain-containing protein [Brevibacillus aydinogluensis]CAJ1004206.1 DUF2892 domain-containing protein [Brevibacillus aydinogluensis]